MAALRRACDWLDGLTLADVHTVLKRLDIVWKRARSVIRSSDPDYEAKLADGAAVLAKARTAPGRLIAVFLDEITIYRQPTLANAYAPRGHEQPRAQLSHQSNTETRAVAALEALTGRVVHRLASKITLSILVQFYCALRAAFPDAECIYVIQDNWLVHTPPDVLVALEVQETR